MNPILHHDLTSAEGEAPSRWMIVAAGIYGSGRNWSSVARRFVDARPDWGCVLVDLRQHGASMGFDPPHTVAACAADLLRLSAHLDVEVGAVLGHSFGGKVALAFAEAAAGASSGPFLERVWVVDSTPEAREPGGSAWAMLDVLRERPGPFGDRGEGIAAVEAGGFPTPVAQWMSTNLIRWSELDEAQQEQWMERADAAQEQAPEPDALVWRLNPGDMESLLRSFFDRDLWGPVESPPPGTEVHLLKALDSSILDEAACARIEAAGLATGTTHLHRVEGGHWVNADNPGALQELLVREMP